MHDLCGFRPGYGELCESSRSMLNPVDGFVLRE
jgi:hypothetical protein